MNVRIINIRHGKKEQGRDGFIYATLINADNGVVYIHATLDYILDSVLRNKYVLVGDHYNG